MNDLVQSPAVPKSTRKSAAVSDYSPDDLLIVQKRQHWRIRAAHICIDHFESLDRTALVGERRPIEEVDRLAARFSRISDYVKSELPSLLASGLSVHELEAVRYQANYFLEELVRHLRHSLQGRHKSKNPLQDSTPADIEHEVTSALRGQNDSLSVFIEDLIQLAEFELEVGYQRERIRLLLGGDRRLASLGNNETIMSAPLEQLWKSLEDFTGVSSYLEEYLPPVLDKASPYPALEEELKVADEQLQILLRERVEPFERLLVLKRAQDQVLCDLEEKLDIGRLLAASISETRIAPLLRELRAARPGVETSGGLEGLYSEVDRLVGELGDLPPEVILPASAPRSDNPRDKLDGDLAGLEGHLRSVLGAAASLCESAGSEGEKERPEPSDPEAALADLDKRLLALRARLAAALPDFRATRERRVTKLREHLCSLMGELRTFLQTSFAHIASKDPRSTESSYHFFLREFSDEARQALLLLKEIRTLEAFINHLVQVNIAGLPLTPENLARILRVLFIEKDEEKKRIPSGEGWKVMSAFLKKLRDDLVPRLQKVCALDGIRYEDKNFLSEWAMDLAHNCTLCLTQHEIGYNLLQEMGRLRDDDDTMTAHHSHLHIVTARTCNAMQKSLTEICMTLTASIPYVSIMRGGIERRASVFFHRQQKILESGDAGLPEAAEEALSPEPVRI